MRLMAKIASVGKTIPAKITTTPTTPHDKMLPRRGGGVGNGDRGAGFMGRIAY
jgi:hypothetical protein